MTARRDLGLLPGLRACFLWASSPGHPTADPLNPAYGIGLKLVSTLVFTVMSALVKHMTTRVPVGEIVFFRSFFALLPLILWLHSRGEFPSGLRTRNTGAHIRRSFFGGGGMVLGFSTLLYLPLPEATALGFVTPLLTVILAAVWLKERVRIYRWSAVVVGLFGVFVMLWPGMTAFAAGTLAAGQALGIALCLAGALCSAISTIEVRRLTQTDSTGAIIFFFFAFMSVLSLASLPFGWRMPSPLELAMLLGIGVLGGMGHILLISCYRHADASLIAPFDYTGMLFAIAIGWFVFGEFPEVLVLVGCAIVVAAGIFVIWREHRLGLIRRRAVETPTKPL